MEAQPPHSVAVFAPISALIGVRPLHFFAGVGAVAMHTYDALASVAHLLALGDVEHLRCWNGIRRRKMWRRRPGDESTQGPPSPSRRRLRGAKLQRRCIRSYAQVPSQPFGKIFFQGGHGKSTEPKGGEPKTRGSLSSLWAACDDSVGQLVKPLGSLPHTITCYDMQVMVWGRAHVIFIASDKRNYHRDCCSIFSVARFASFATVGQRTRVFRK